MGIFVLLRRLRKSSCGKRWRLAPRPPHCSFRVQWTPLLYVGYQKGTKSFVQACVPVKNQKLQPLSVGVGSCKWTMTRKQCTSGHKFVMSSPTLTRVRLGEGGEKHYFAAERHLFSTCRKKWLGVWGIFYPSAFYLLPLGFTLRTIPSSSTSQFQANFGWCCRNKKHRKMRLDGV